MRTGARGKKCEGRAERRRQRKMTAVYNQKNIFVIVCLSFPSVHWTFLPAAVKTENGVLCFVCFTSSGGVIKLWAKTKLELFKVLFSLVSFLIQLAASNGHIQIFLIYPQTMDDYCGRGTLSTKLCLLFLWHNFICLYKVLMRGQSPAKRNKEKIYFLDDVVFCPWEKSKAVQIVCLGSFNIHGSNTVLEHVYESNYCRCM